MKLYLRYIGWSYFKYFIILFFALECFYVGVDFITNFKNIPSGTNIKILYTAFTFLTAISYILPISIVFALIITKFNMIKNNELISFYSLGITKNKVILMPFAISVLITLFYIGLNFTPFAYIAEYQKNVSNFNNVKKAQDEMFLKYKGDYIYINSMDLRKQEAYGVKVFTTKEQNLISKRDINKSKYYNKQWLFYDLNLTTIPENIELGKEGYSKKYITEEERLRGFSPNIIVNVYNSSVNHTIKELVESIFILKNEKINIDNLKANLYQMIFFPFFAPFMVLILYYFLPITGRFFNLALLSFVFFIVTLCVWGALFVLIRFALNGALMPEAAIILPIIILFGYSGYLFFKNR